MRDVVLNLLEALRWAMKSGDACRCLSGAVCTGHQAIKQAETFLAANA